MFKNIDTLADKIYEEGVAKAQNEATGIIENAKQQAESLIKEAHQISSKIIEHARKQADEIHSKTLTDTRLAGNKAINSIKQEIKKLLNQQVLQKPIENLFSDIDFLKELIITISKKYGEDPATVLLPAKLKEKFECAMEGSIQKELEGFTVDFNKSFDGGFQILRKDQNYVITFTDRDFIEFLKPFLNEKTEEILFKK